MCGIAGWVNLDTERPVEPGPLREMTRTLIHRGPDDEGYFVHQNVGLGHRRLSIIDLSEKGRQPLFNGSKSVAVVFNGEIYNHLDLKKELEAKGHAFTTRTDTEALVHGYEEWGPKMLPRLDGMFALAVYDLVDRRLLLATDPFGKKPLYYALQKGAFLFASELKAFYPNPFFQARLDLEAVRLYLAHDFVPTPKTILQDCHKLQPGSSLEVDTRNAEVLPEPARYFRPVYEPKLELSEEEAAQRLVESLRAAIKKRLMSDVPLGVFLSGGIDSSSLVALLAEMGGPRTKTFTVGFREKSFDESDYASDMAARFGTEHHHQYLDPGVMLEVLPEILSQLDEPFADASIIPTYLLSRFTRREVTVALGGDGGDEILAGYDPFVAHRLAGPLAHLPKPVIRGLRKAAGLLPVSDRNMSPAFRLKHFFKGLAIAGNNLPELRNMAWLGAFTPETMGAVLPAGREVDFSAESVYGETLRLAAESRAREPLDRLIDNYLGQYLRDGILVKVDRASMMNSLEVRSPFLDKDLTGLVNRLPGQFKMKGLTRKYILKEALAGRLPKKITRRSKKGFGVPLGEWFKGPLKDLVKETLSARRLDREGFLAGAGVAGLVEDHFSGRSDNRKEIWNLLVFELWRQERGL